MKTNKLFKLTALLISLIITVTALPFASTATDFWQTEHTVEIDGITFKYIDGSRDYPVITGIVYEGDELIDIVFPAEIDTGTDYKWISSIADNAFAGCEFIRSVTFSDAIYSIGENAFNGCTNLEEVNFSENEWGAYIIDNFAFKNCTSLKSIQFFERSALYSNCFAGCSSLTEIIIPEGATLFGSGMFRDCTSLVSADIGVYNVPSAMFLNCTSLKNVTFNYETEEEYSIGYDAFNGCSSLKEILLPETLTELGHQAFNKCSSLETITIPSGIEMIQSCTFNGCASLTSVTLPENDVYIDAAAFQHCSSLAEINNAENVTNIGRYAFNGCSSLEEFTCSYKTTNIEQGAFMDCTDLKSITLPSNTDKLNANTFENCVSLEKIIIPEGYTSIGEYVFKGCASLNEIIFPDSLTAIAPNALIGSAYYENADNWVNDVLYVGKHLIKAKINAGTHLYIKEGTKVIAANAFDGCSNMGSIVLPESIEYIGSYSFVNSSTIESVGYMGTREEWENKVTVSNISYFPDDKLTFLNENYIAGDVNCDGVVSTVDLLLFRKNMAKALGDEYICNEACDVNCDGIINAKDILSLRKALAS